MATRAWRGRFWPVALCFLTAMSPNTLAEAHLAPLSKSSAVLALMLLAVTSPAAVHGGQFGVSLSGSPFGAVSGWVAAVAVQTVAAEIAKGHSSSERRHEEAGYGEGKANDSGNGTDDVGRDVDEQRNVAAEDTVEVAEENVEIHRTEIGGDLSRRRREPEMHSSSSREDELNPIGLEAVLERTSALSARVASLIADDVDTWAPPLSSRKRAEPIGKEKNCQPAFKFASSVELMDQTGRLGFCLEHEKLTCCDRRDSEDLRRQLSSLLAVDNDVEISQKCKNLVLKAHCSLCDAAVGIGFASNANGKPILCQKFCDTWYDACRDEFFQPLDPTGAGDKVVPCRSGSTVCAKLSAVIDDGHEMCQRMGFDVANDESSSMNRKCFDGIPTAALWKVKGAKPSLSKAYRSGTQSWRPRQRTLYEEYVHAGNLFVFVGRMLQKYGTQLKDFVTTLRQPSW